MHSGTKQIIRRIILITFFVVGCKPAMHTPQTAPAIPNNEPEQIIEKELVPSWETPISTDSKVPIYEEPEMKIKNPFGEIILGRIDIEHAKMTYSVHERKMIVVGSARVLDNQKKEVAQSSFNLVGTHTAGQNIFDLVPQFSEKEDSSKKPVVRARVTCLDVNSDSQSDCNHITVDFFVRYKKENLTQQMEISKAKEAVAPEEKVEVEEVIDLKKEDNPAQIEADLEKSAPEGVELSIPGPNMTQTQQVNLTEMFANDEDTTPTIDPVKSDTPAPVTPPVKKPVTPVKPGQPPRAEDTAIKKGEEKLLSKDLKITSTGNIRPYNQASGFADQGKLRNATSVLIKQQALDKKASFEIAVSKNNSYYGTYEMAEMLNRLGDKLYSTFANKIYISSISLKEGGKFLPHASHQNGTDSDIGYPTNIAGVKFPAVATTEIIKETKNTPKKEIVHFYPNRYSVEKTYELLKFAFKQTDLEVERVFVDRMIKNDLCNYAIKKGEFKAADKDSVQRMFEKIEHVDGHGDHFHVRLKCSAEDNLCLPKRYTKNDGCGNVIK